VNKDAFYPPLFGGRHGGRVFLSQNSRTVCVERFVRDKNAKHRTSEGQDLSVEEYQGLIGHIDQRLFNSVFSFGLSELSSFESLQSEEIRDRIFSAGIVGAGRSARAVSEALEKRNEVLLRSRRKTQAVINDLLREYEENEKAIAEARLLLGDYENFRLEIARLSSEHFALQQDLQRRQQEIARTSLLLELWETYFELCEAEKELDLLGDVPILERDSSAKAAALFERIETLRSQLNDLESRAVVLQKEVLDLTTTLASPLALVLDELELRLGELKLHENRLARLSARRAEISSLEKEMALGISALGLCWGEPELWQADLTPQVRDEIRVYKKTLSENEADRVRLKEEQRQASVEINLDNNLESDSFGPAEDPLGVFRQRLKTAVIAALTVAISSVGMAWLGASFSVSETFVAGFVLLAVLLFGFSFSAGLFLRVEKKRLKNEIRTRDLLNLDKKKRLAARLQEIDAALVTLGDRHKQSLYEWRKFLVDRCLPETLTPEGVLDLFSSLAEMKAGLRRLDDSRMEERALSREVELWEQAVRHLLGRADISLPGGDSQAVVTNLGSLISKVLELRESQREIKDRDKELHELRLKKEALLLQIGVVERQQRDIYDRAGAASEDDFQAAVRRSQRASELRALVTERKQHIDRRLGKGDESTQLWEKLKTGDLHFWAEHLEQDKADILELERKKEEIGRCLVEAEHKRKALESSADLVAFEFRKQQLFEQFGKFVEQWLENSLAKALVEKTLQVFVKSRQPEVLKQASRSFSNVTAGVYTEVASGPDGISLQVCKNSGEIIDPKVLSTGTSEQLYLCVRMAFASEFKKRTCPMPIIMDDILVNFDPHRAKVLAQELAAFAKEHQVLFFTCHPATADLFRETVPEVEVRHLSSTYGGAI
jgi:uncharacterized protein YhaN